MPYLSESEHKQILLNLKHNAPFVYNDLKNKRIRRYTKELDNLRVLYSFTTDETEKLKITKEAEDIKRRLKLYKP